MDWTMIGALGELLGALVVVISVIYLASQVRQNTAVVRADAARSFSMEASRAFVQWGSDERNSEILHKVIYEQVGRADLPATDALRASFLLISRASLLDAAFRSYKESILSEEEFRALLTSRIWDLPFVKDSWPIWRTELSPDFVAYMETTLPQLVGDVPD